MAQRELADKLNANPADVLLSIVEVLKKERVTAQEVAAATVEAAAGRKPHSDVQLEAGISEVLHGLNKLASSQRNYHVALRNRPGYRKVLSGTAAITQRLQELSEPTPAIAPATAKATAAGDVPAVPALSAEQLDELLTELSALRYVLPRKPFGPDYPLLDEVLDGFVAELSGESLKAKQLQKAAALMVPPLELQEASVAERRAWGRLRGHMTIAAEAVANRDDVDITRRTKFAGAVSTAVESYRSVVEQAELGAGPTL